MAEECLQVLKPPTTLGPFTFKAFGLTISSCIHCPELVHGTGTPEVRVEYGDVPLDLPAARSNGVRYQAMPGQLLLQVDGVARFLVRNGNEIIIDRHPDASEDDVRVFLLGSALGALMHQRGILVLHGSTVKIDDGCAVFLGKSGAGKSTLATSLRQRGFSCLGDDLCAIYIGEDGVPYAAPAYPQAKLWIDSLQHFGIDSSSLRRIRPILEKRAVPFEGSWSDELVPIRRLYVLTPSRTIETCTLKSVTGSDKIRVLRNYTYRVEFLHGLDLGVRHFKQLAQLASRLAVTRVLRPGAQFITEQLASAIEGDFRT